MKIGIDAKWFFSGNPSGRVVIRNILEHLLANNPQHEFYVFLKKHEKGKVFPYLSPNAHLIYVWGRINLISNLLFLPLRALFLGLDICLFQSFCPPLSPYKRITFIFDVIFKSNPEYFTLWERLYFIPMVWSARSSHTVVTISHSEKKRICDYRVSSPGKTKVIYMGVDPAFEPREHQQPKMINETIREYKLPEQFLLYVGRLNQRKNIGNLLKSVSLLKDTSIKLVLTGAPDWKMFNVTQYVNDLNINDRILFTGFIKHQHLPVLYSLATVFCFVSFDEGFGLPPLEAMACGVPVVVADAGSLPEVCKEAGTYVNPHKPEEIADKINFLLDNKAYWQEKRAAGLIRAAMFSWKQSAHDLMSYIEETAR